MDTSAYQERGIGLARAVDWSLVPIICRYREIMWVCGRSKTAAFDILKSGHIPLIPPCRGNAEKAVTKDNLRKFLEGAL